MDRSEITDEVFMASVNKIIDANPDYIYKSPALDGIGVYSYWAKPSCLIGHILLDLGFSIIDLVSFDGRERNRFYEFSLKDIIAKEMPKVSKEMTKFAVWLQTYQDDGRTWSASRELALQEL
jgi:hypothetical protein